MLRDGASLVRGVCASGKCSCTNRWAPPSTCPPKMANPLVFEHAGLQATVRTPLNAIFHAHCEALSASTTSQEGRTLFTFVAITQAQTLDCASRSCFKMHRSVSASVRRLAGGTTSTSSHHRSRSLISAGSLFTLTTGTLLDPEA